MSYDPIFPTTKGILRKLGGDKISGKLYTFDGNLEGKEYFELQPGNFLVKVSDETCDPNSIESISWKQKNEIVTERKENFTFEEADDNGNIIIYYETLQIAFICNETYADLITPGIWVLYQHYDFGTPTYVTKIQLADTIVPISKDYLGGICLPVVELGTVLTTDGAVLTVDEAQKMEALNGGLAVFTCNTEDAKFTAIPIIVEAEGAFSYVVSFDNLILIIGKQDGVWVASKYVIN